MRAVALSAAQREQALAELVTGSFDVLVIGAGVVGAGCALDAVTRGLRVGLVEARDFAAGTSSRSSKLVHGGLRYLEMLDFALVAEALRERDLMMWRLAPHLVRPVPFLYPLRHRGWERWYAGAGVALYDALSLASGRSRRLPWHRHLSRRHALRLAPSLRADSLVGAIKFYDGQVDDARHTLFLARTAASHGAVVASRARVVALLREGPRVVGATVRDLESGRLFDVRARQVISATGVWADETQALTGRPSRSRVRASKGVHLVVPGHRIRSDSGLILRTSTSVLFVIPWDRHWIIGTTDTDWRLDKAHPAASRSDIGYLLRQVNKVLVDPLTPDDVQGVYAGLRPLVAGDSELTSRLTREHVVARVVSGLVVVTGGKYTTYRVMARDAVDEAARELVQHYRCSVSASVTDRVPLVGADGVGGLYQSRHAMARQSGLATVRIEHLLRRYGSLVHELLDLIAADRSLAEPVLGAEDYLRVEIAYAASHEGARHLDDALARRTRISIETFDRGLTAAADASRLMGRALGWSAEQKRREVEHYEMRVAAERHSQQMPDDETADAARLGAPDVVPLA